MTYKYKCLNCKRTITKQNKKVLVVCGCGYEMVLIKMKGGKKQK